MIGSEEPPKIREQFIEFLAHGKHVSIVRGNKLRVNASPNGGCAKKLLVRCERWMDAHFASALRDHAVGEKRRFVSLRAAKGGDLCPAGVSNLLVSKE